MRIGIAQLRPQLGRLEQNVENHLNLIKKAKEKQCRSFDLSRIKFTGYHLLILRLM